MFRLLFLILLGVLLLSFFGVSLRTLVESPVTQQNFAFLWQLVLNGWHWLANLFSGILTPLSKALGGLGSAFHQ